MAEAARVCVESFDGVRVSGAGTVTHHFPHSTSTCGLEFFSDEFLRVLILRFIFCEIVLRLHKDFQARFLIYWQTLKPSTCNLIYVLCVCSTQLVTVHEVSPIFLDSSNFLIATGRAGAVSGNCKPLSLNWCDYSAWRTCSP